MSGALTAVPAALLFAVLPARCPALGARELAAVFCFSSRMCCLSPSPTSGAAGTKALT